MIPSRDRATHSLVGAVALAALFLLAFCSSAMAATINCSWQYTHCHGTYEWDYIYGGPNFNEIAAEEGRDDVWGYAAGDFIFGMRDGDTLYGGEGYDYLYGQEGNDSLHIVGEGAGLYGNSQTDEIEGNVGFDLLQGNYGYDYLRGGDHDDVLHSEDGEADMVNGGNSVGQEPCYVDGYDAFYSCDPF